MSFDEEAASSVAATQFDPCYLHKTEDTGESPAGEIKVQRLPWDLQRLVASLHDVDPPPLGFIAYPTDKRFLHYFSSYLKPASLQLGPCWQGDHSRGYQAWRMHGYKDELLCSLVRRGNYDGDDAAKAKCKLQCHVGCLAPKIRRQYGLAEKAEQLWEEPDKALIKVMLLDGCFIVELLLRHWHAMTAVAGWKRRQPSLHRQDMLVATNQIPYIVIEELFRTARLPELPRGDELDVLLKRLAISYLVADEAAKELLYSYKGPVYHLLHLLHLHFTFSLHRSPQRTPRPLRARLVRRRVRALARPDAAAAVSRGLARGWWAHKAIPTVRDLAAVGMLFRPRDALCLADVAFDGDVLEIPAFTYMDGGFDAHLLVNMAALETAGWWEAPQLFVEYAVFMSELVATDEDAGLLRERGVLHGDSSPASFFRVLADIKEETAPGGRFADIKEGAEPGGRFADIKEGVEPGERFAVLTADVNRCYSQLKKASKVTCCSG